MTGFRFGLAMWAAVALGMVPASQALAQDAALEDISTRLADVVQETEPGTVPRPSDTAVQTENPEIIPTSFFASRSDFSDVSLSPDGTRFAFATVREKRQFISVYDSDTLELVDGLNLGNPENFKWFSWAGNDRLLISMRGNDQTYGLPFSRLVSFEFDGRNMRTLSLPRMGFDGDNVVHVNREGTFVAVSIAESPWRTPAVWRFDLETPVEEGVSEIRGTLVEAAQDNIAVWIADNGGTVRIGIGARGRGRVEIYYRRDASEDWRRVARVRRDDEDAFEYFDFMGLRPGSDDGYVVAIPEGSERFALMEFNFATFQPGAILFQSQDEDVDAVTFDSTRTPVAVSYAGDDFRREWLDPEIRRQRQLLSEALPGSEITIVDLTEDHNRMLVAQSGPADPGALYVFTPGTGSLDLFAEIRPQIDPQLLSAPEPVEYTARDGTHIHGYLTLPKSREPRGLPLIVHPHGGPYGIRDTLTYSDMVQLLANRGYAVIQPNFRGSGGYGEAFEALGDGQVGRAMQDDLDDAVAYLVGEGIVDPQRVCIIGSSYGGFAAVWGVIRNPEIYRCAASFAGVMHWERQLSHNRDFLYGDQRGRHTRRYDGDQTNFDLDDISPAVQVQRLRRPVLLVHGERDSRVPFRQHELMVDRADDADIELETLELEDSGHGFYNPEDEQAYYDAIVDFLARHNPAD